MKSLKREWATRFNKRRLPVRLTRNTKSLKACLTVTLKAQLLALLTDWVLLMETSPRLNMSTMTTPHSASPSQTPSRQCPSQQQRKKPTKSLLPPSTSPLSSEAPQEMHRNPLLTQPAAPRFQRNQETPPFPHRPSNSPIDQWLPLNRRTLLSSAQQAVHP